MNRPSIHARGYAVTALFLGLLAGGGTAQAQWVWKDATGNPTFSDVPPPPDVKPEQILRRPGATVSPAAPAPGTAPQAAPADGPAPAPAGAPGAAAGAKPASGPKTIAEQEADFRKRQQERQKAEQKEAEDRAKAEQKQAACNQAQGYLSMVQSGTRLMRPNPDGTRGYMDDDARSAEMQRAQEQVSQNCN
jgi:hypothetical protein